MIMPVATQPIPRTAHAATLSRADSLQHEIDMLRQEIRVARQAAEITASLVVAQFEETEKILRRLQFANALRQTVLDSATQMAIIATDNSGKIIIFNSGAENMLGYRMDEIIGLKKPESFHLQTEIAARTRQLSRQCGRPIKPDRVLYEHAKHGTFKKSDWMLQRKNGDLFPAQISVNALKDPDGAVNGLLYIAIDISERKQVEQTLQNAQQELEKRVSQRTEQLANANRELQTEIRERRLAEQALKASERKYRGIVDNATEGIFQSTPQGRLLMANPAMARIMGHDSIESLIENTTDISCQFYVDPQRRREFKNAIREHGAVKGFDAKFHRRDGTIIDININARLVSDDAGKPLYYEGILEDVTQKIHAAEMKIARDAAQAATKAKSDFLANMSHEIRTPMNAIIGMGELALNTDLTPKQHDYLSKMNKAAHMLLGIINDILDFSKIEAGRMELELIDFDLHEVINNLSDMFAGTVADKGIELLLSVAADAPCRLLGDPLRLEQVLINLINNAVKFTDSGQILVKVTTLSQTSDQTRLRFAVRDSGIGIDPAYLPDLFSSFSQADGSTTRKFGGTGLGLSICKQLVELMHGQITVDSAPGKGSEFVFSAQFKLRHAMQRISLPLEIVGKRALIVDDNLYAREMLADMLGSFKLETTAVASGADALQELQHAAQTQPYALVLLDWMMPEMDGIATLKHIRNHPEMKDTPVVMMTAYGREQVMQRAESAGTQALLLKPLKQSLLFDTIVDLFGMESRPDARRYLNKPNEKNESKHFCGHVLLVEDNLLNQQVAMEMLQNYGLDVQSAYNGNQAIQMLDSHDFDAVFMDIQMPEMDGFEATRHIRRTPRHIDLPIIAMTAHAMQGDRDKCLSAGMNDYVTKPIDTKQLLRALSRWLKPDRHQPAAPADTGTSHDRSARPDLPGIDVAEATARIGDRALLYSLLLQFADSHKADADKMRRALADGDKPLLRRLAHTIKGVAGNLSANSLAISASALEKALDAPDSKTITNAIGEFDTQLARVIQTAQSIVPRPQSLSPPLVAEDSPAAANPDELNKKTAALLELLEANDLEAEAYFQQIKPLLPPSSAAVMAKWIMALDFEQAGAELRKINLLSTSMPGEPAND